MIAPRQRDPLFKLQTFRASLSHVSDPSDKSRRHLAYPANVP
eukprot:CAMPEP_0184410214 /NCGR_PEP_ID=MMETSP0738-20130409/4703_1 /TAXON_ID=385413 /ORGANISM="Thalassiosira miniscula, Strain CCMP1093" /LENGTH=41 /DNA_ID= /DNA_START= /DNA_END= /DNA_ORIENTATION=